MAINIKCPLCGANTKTRSSEHLTPTVIEADLFCGNCGNFKGKFRGEFTKMRVAKWEESTELKNAIYEENKAKIY